MCVGFNVETVEYKNISFTVWDVGGQDKVRVKTRERRAAARDGRAVEDVRGGGAYSEPRVDFHRLVVDICDSCALLTDEEHVCVCVLFVLRADSTALASLLPKHSRFDLCRG